MSPQPYEAATSKGDGLNHLFKVVLFSVSVILLALPIGAAEIDSLSSERQRTITVHGEASLSMIPNLAVISFGVITQSEQVASALDENNESMVKLFDTIKTIGIADKNVRTSGFNVIPQYPINNFLV